MAAVAEMGEVDEIHSNEESIRDGASVNGDVCEFNKEADEDPDEIIESTNVSEDEMVEHEENNSDNDDDDAQFRQIHSVEEQEVDEDDDDDDEDKMEVEEIGSVEQIHEINNSDDEEIRNGLDDGTGDSDKLDDNNSIIIHDSGEADCDDVVILDDTDPIENGTIDMTADDVEITEPIDDLGSSNDTDTQINKKKLISEQVAFRRSIRNFGKERRSYAKKEKLKPLQMPEPQPCDSSDMSDIEEILPEDPLAVIESTPSPQTKPPKKKTRLSSSTIVVKDTKRLAEIASKSTANNNNKKEPTLVIIDTNSILSGRGPIPITQKASMSNSPITNSFPMLPMALPAQAVPATRPPTTAPTLPPTPPVLPTLTDDMFVVEAPSFIVPYVYEKPPLKDLKACIKTLENEIKESEESDKAKESKRVDSESKEEDPKTDTPESGKKDDNADKDESKKEGSDVEAVNEKQEARDFELDLPVMPIPNTANALAAELRKPATYFDSALGKFFMGIGYGLVQESVQTDLLKQQKRKRDRENWENSETIKTINSLIKNLEYTKENNAPYRMPTKKCEYCSFKTESSLAMSFHLETPHMKNYVYRCNFCTYEVRSPHDILFHMEVKHGVRGRLERAPAFHQCPNCPFEDNQKGKLSRHSVACMRKFKPERNLEPPADFEPPAKIPRMPRMKQQGMGSAAAVYQAMRGRGRPSMGLPIAKHIPPSIRPANTSILYKPSGSMSGGSVLVPTNYQLSGNPLYQQQQGGTNKTKTTNQPSISITPLPRGTTATGLTVNKPGDTNPKNSFVICEICDGYIKDLEQLRNHMQWIHKVKIHPKMIYNRPPLNCQKCQFRFFTDQGLERHLLGSHGLVTSSMQEAANRSKDAGRCPVCGRVYQWKLLNHVGRDHNMTLKPAHLSYKCTVCTATFGMYKQFENHVYSAHSVVTKRVVDKKGASPASSTGSSSKSESLLKPLKINDEITIIPQPAKSTNGDTDDCSIASTSGLSATSVRASNGNASASKGEC